MTSLRPDKYYIVPYNDRFQVPHEAMQIITTHTARKTRYSSRFDEVPVNVCISRKTSEAITLLLFFWQKERGKDGWAVISNFNGLAKTINIDGWELKSIIADILINRFDLIAPDRWEGENVVVVNKVYIFEYQCIVKTEQQIKQITIKKGGGDKADKEIIMRSVAIKIRPARWVLDALTGKGRGYKWVSADAIYMPHLSTLWAFKLYWSIARLCPSFKISFKTLSSRQYLNCEKEISKRGKPWVLNNIKAGMDTLLKLGVVKWWEYDELRDTLKGEIDDKNNYVWQGGNI